MEQYFYLKEHFMMDYRIAGNFRGRKLSRISQFFRHTRKFSPRNSRHATPIMRPVLTFRESFLREMLLSYRSAKVFSLENFPLYGVWCITRERGLTPLPLKEGWLEPLIFESTYYLKTNNYLQTKASKYFGTQKNSLRIKNLLGDHACP